MNAADLAQNLQHKKFSSTFIGGYKKKEVHAYLEKLNEEWEKLTEENRSLRHKLEKAEAEIYQLRNIETSLLTSLKDQQEANKRIIEQSREEAKLRIARGQIKANNMVKQAEIKSREILRNANEKYQEKLNRMRAELKILQDNYQVVDEQTSRLIKEMTVIMKETMIHLSKLSSLKKISVHNEFSELNEFLSEKLKAQKNHVMQPKPKAKQQAAPLNSKKESRSFFDEVELSAN